MNKTFLATTILTAFTILNAEASPTKHTKMEKCKLIGPDGKSLIKPAKSDCAGGKNSCAGANVDGDPEAWIYLPAGACDKIKGGSVAK